MKLKKFIAIILVSLSAACIAVGFSGCGSSGFLSDKGYDIPDSILLQESPLSSYIEIIEDRSTRKEIYNMFNSVKFECCEITAQTDNSTGVILAAFHYENSQICFYVRPSGRVECQINAVYYVSDEGAVNYELLKSYIKQ